MKCHFCNYHSTSVKDSRLNQDRSTTKRRRHCNKCDSRFTTEEMVVENARYIQNKEGEREAFQSNKLFFCIFKAFYGSEVEEKSIFSVMDKVITYDEICCIISTEIKHVDLAVYVKFISEQKKYASLEELVYKLTNNEKRQC